MSLYDFLSVCRKTSVLLQITSSLGGKSGDMSVSCGKGAPAAKRGTDTSPQTKRERETNSVVGCQEAPATLGNQQAVGSSGIEHLWCNSSLSTSQPRRLHPSPPSNYPSGSASGCKCWLPRELPGLWYPAKEFSQHENAVTALRFSSIARWKMQKVLHVSGHGPEIRFYRAPGKTTVFLRIG